MWVISKSCDGLTAMLLLKVTRKRTLRAHVRKLCAVATRGAAPPTPRPALAPRGLWDRQPSRAHLEDVKREPLTEPKQDRPTKTGMIQDMTPKW